jgi:hypothetical protein
MTWGQAVKLEMPDAPSVNPGAGEVEIIPPSVVRAPSRPSDDDGLQLPDCLLRADPACVIGGDRL